MGPIAVDSLDDGTFVCRPPGDGPFPGILYNHGGLGDAVGGDLEGTCRAFAEIGYVARSQRRMNTVPLTGHLDTVLLGLDALRADESVDNNRIGMIGFSRGGLLTLQAAIERPDQMHAVIVCAPAPARDTLERTLERVAAIQAPVRVMVSQNDQQNMRGMMVDHVVLSTSVADALRAAGKEVELTVYPPFEDDGHRLFFEVRDPWWSDAAAFFNGHLQR